MTKLEETTDIVSVDKLREQALLELGQPQAPKIKEEALSAVRSADSYAGLLSAILWVEGSIHDKTDRAVVAHYLGDVQVWALQQLARIEREHQSSTSLEALRDRVVGILDDTEYAPGKIKRAQTYEELLTIVDDVMLWFVQRSWDRVTNPLADVRAVLRSKVAEQQ